MAQYGKLAGGGVGLLVATAAVETLDQYLPHELPNSVVLAIAALLALTGIFSIPHDAIQTQPKEPSP